MEPFNNEKEKLLSIIYNSGEEEKGKPYGSVLTTYGRFFWFRRSHLTEEEVKSRLSIYRQNYNENNPAKFREFLRRRHSFPSYWLGDYDKTLRMYPVYYGYSAPCMRGDDPSS